MLESVQRVARVVKDEEHRYATTFLVAENVFQRRAIKGSRRQGIPGALSFKLYDTYGLALDEQEEMAREHGLTIDREAFEAEMEQQRERARASWKGAEKGAVAPAYQELLEQGRTKFLGYNELEATSRVVGLLVDQAAGGQRRGGHEGGTGARPDAVLRGDPAARWAITASLLRCRHGEKVADVETTYPAVPGLTVHRIQTLRPLAVGDALRAEVAVRCATRDQRNHTATHLLHAALRTGAGNAREAGGQRGGAAAPALRFHALRGAGSRGARGSGAADQRADSAQHRGHHGRHAARSGDRHRRDGAVRREVWRARFAW